MKLPINDYLRGVIRQFVTSASEKSALKNEDPAFDVVLQDVKHFHHQTEELTKRNLPQFVAVFYDEDDRNRMRELQVPIQAPD